MEVDRILRLFYPFEMITKADFKKLIYVPFKEQGFSKKGDSWYLNTDEIVAVVAFTKSDWSEKYSITMGFGIKALGIIEFPQSNFCHVYTSPEDIFPEHRRQIDCGCALTEELGYSDEDLNWLIGFINSDLIPFCKSNMTEKALGKFREEPFKSRAIMSKDTRERLCGISRDPSESLKAFNVEADGMDL